jgi:hypothetical protein
LFFIELEAGWVLELVWMFWRREFSCCCQDLNPDLPACIHVTVLTVLPHTDVQIIHKSIIIWDGRFGLDMFNV